MQIWRSLSDVRTTLDASVVTIGNFDGVHRGHRHVVRRAGEIAEARGLPLVAVTFDPHPMAVLRPEHAPVTLSDIPERARLLAAIGVDHVVVLDFTREMAGWSPETFVDRVLVGALHAAAVVVGANFRFGAKAAGDLDTLRAAGASAGFTVEGVALDGGPQVWSSTYVRSCLAAGDIEGATEALGRYPVVRGVVEQGERRGRDLGFPTANVGLADAGCAPADGVYAGWLSLEAGQRWPAAISVGTNPTFAGERSRRVEAYVLDRDDLDLYGHEVSVEFVARIRPMLRFEDVESLVKQMHDDVARTRELLAPRAN